MQESNNEIGPRSSVRQNGFSNGDFRQTQLETECPDTPACNFQSKYRTIDGSCNNINQPKYGMSKTPLQRILPNEYSDGKCSFGLFVYASGCSL